MKFGVIASAECAEPNRDWRDRLERIAAWGFEGVELRIRDPRDLAAVRDAGRLLGELGLRATVAGGNDARCPLAEHVCRLVDACAVLDADVLCGAFDFGDDASGIDALSSVAHYAGLFGITLALGGRDYRLQPRGPTIAETLRLIDAVGSRHLGVTYNTYQAHVQESSISAAILSAGNRIRYVQIAENDRAVPGTGQVGWLETFAALETIDYDGWYVIDAAHDADIERIAVGGLHFLRRGVRRSA